MTSEGAGALASGKGHRDENFPVASVLLRPAARAPILAFYRFARAADDVADNPTASASDKLALLEAIRATLLGEADVDSTALSLREVIAGRGLDRRHPLDLLEAFRRDVTKTRYANWDELIDYCRVSAMPVGRFVLDVHGEDRATWAANDALCAALQINNHLQDCGKDYRKLNRVYVPRDALEAAGVAVEELGAAKSSPALLACLRKLAERNEALLTQSASFSSQVKDMRLGMEISVIDAFARRIVGLLKTHDPLCEKVHLSKGEMLRLAALSAAAEFGRRMTGTKSMPRLSTGA